MAMGEPSKIPVVVSCEEQIHLQKSPLQPSSKTSLPAGVERGQLIPGEACQEFEEKEVFIHKKPSIPFNEYKVRRKVFPPISKTH